MKTSLSRWFIGTLPVVLMIRAFVACSSSDDAPSGAEAGADGNVSPGDGSDPSHPGEDPTGSDGAPPPPPSYCNGIIFYSSFDKPEGVAAAPDFGSATAHATGDTRGADGQFGQGVSLSVDAGGDGAALFFDQDDAGAPIYAQTEGTIALWLRRKGALAPNGVIMRPLSNVNAVTSAGLLFGASSNLFGLWTNINFKPVITVSVSSLAPFRRPGGFDHYAAGWRHSIDGGSPLAIFAINGGLGEMFGAEGADGGAPVFADAAPDDAGSVRPFRARTTPTPDIESFGEFVSLRLGGTTTTAPGGDVDDVAVWNRVLSFDEIAELYQRGESIGSACRF